MFKPSLVRLHISRKTCSLSLFPGLAFFPSQSSDEIGQTVAVACIARPCTASTCLTRFILIAIIVPFPVLSQDNQRSTMVVLSGDHRHPGASDCVRSASSMLCSLNVLTPKGTALNHAFTSIGPKETFPGLYSVDWFCTQDSKADLCDDVHIRYLQLMGSARSKSAHPWLQIL